MKNILDFTRQDLANWFETKGIQPFRARQVFTWLYIKQARSFEEMTDLSKKMREMMSSHFVIGGLELEEKMVSVDTTEKYLFRLEDGHHIESVLIPGKDHFTLCVSSQVGCAMDCRFCLTAKGGFIRNLTQAEIVGQVWQARNFMIDKGMDLQRVSNIVFMGMGEPLANYDTVVRAISIICDTDFGMKFSPKRVTVSTSGLVPKILALGEETEVNLAVSLNAVDDETRIRLMPINKTYDLGTLLSACKRFNMKPRNKITFEYILIKDVNDSIEDAKKLVKILTPIRAKVNLIPFNEHPGSDFKRPSNNRIHAFLKVLLDKGMTAIIRKSMGDDILAACGQLRAKLETENPIS